MERGAHGWNTAFADAIMNCLNVRLPMILRERCTLDLLQGCTVQPDGQRNHYDKQRLEDRACYLAAYLLEHHSSSSRYQAGLLGAGTAS
jgi:hypothetical protein